MQPSPDIAPLVGFSPKTPQKLEGLMMDPTDCVAIASGTMRAATAAPDPLEEPPGVCARLCGLRVGPARAIAYSVVTVVPMMMAPAALRRRTSAASHAGTRPAWIGVPHVQCMPATSTVS